MTEVEWMLKKIRETRLDSDGNWHLVVALLDELRGLIPAHERFVLTVDAIIRRYNAESGEQMTVAEGLRLARELRRESGEVQ